MNQLSKRILVSLLPTILLLSGGCGGMEKAEAVTAEETAAQIEGRKAARLILGTDLKDSVALRQLIDTQMHKAHSKLASPDDNKQKAAFDSAYISTIRAVRPDVARTAGYLGK